MATFSEGAAYFVDRMLSLYLVFIILVVSHVDSRAKHWL